MAVVAPFRAVTYNFKKIGNLGNVVAPPYDIISDKDQDKYYKRDPYNVVRLIFGKMKTGDSDWDNRYTRAADLLKRWHSEEILVKLEIPSLFLTSITYESPDMIDTRTRWGFIALVRIEDNDSCVILPHERTFTFHREDRLRLMRACNAQLSPVFGLYQDENNVIMSSFENTKESPPMVSFKGPDGYFYRMWQVPDESVAEEITSKMASKSVIIADGHHRYETVRNYRNLMRARFGSHTSRSYEYVMMYLTNMNDKGLTILPTHRLFQSYPDFKISRFLSSASIWFDIYSFPFQVKNKKKLAKILLSQLQEYGRNRTVIGFYHTGSKNYHLLSLKSEATDEIGDDLHPSLKKVDVSVLSRLIFQRILGITQDDLDNEKIIHYESSTNIALSSVLSGEYQMVFLLNQPKIEQILEVTGNSLLMPRKSTYFYPKILSGLVFNEIDLHEKIQIPRKKIR
jgi:uncharacterized protein (DUF1015 family)